MQKGKAIFAFTLKNKEGKEDTWYIDLKDAGKVSKEAPNEADGTGASERPKRRGSRVLTLVIDSHSLAVRQ